MCERREGAYFASWFGRGLVLRERSTSSPNVFDSSHAELCPCAPTHPFVDFGAAKLATGHGHGERIYPKVSSFFRPVQFFSKEPVSDCVVELCCQLCNQLRTDLLGVTVVFALPRKPIILVSNIGHGRHQDLFFLQN